MAFGGLKGTLTGNGNSVGTSNAITGSVAAVVGDLVFVTFGQQTNLTATTCSDNLGNTYTATNAGTDAGTATGRSYYSRVTVAGTITQVTVAASSSTNDWAGFAAVIEGPFKTSPLDKNIANTTGDLSSPFTCPATGTLTQANEVIMCWMASDGSATWSATSPNLKAGQANNSTNIKVIIGYQAVSSTSTVSPEFTGTNPGVDVLGTSTFMKDLTQTLTASLYSDSDTFHSATLTPGAINLAPSLFADGDTFYTHTLSATITLSPSLFSDGDTFYSAAITVGAVDLTASLFTDGDTFNSAAISGTINLDPSLFSDSDSFFTHSLAATIDLASSLFADGDTFNSHSLSATIDIAAGLYADGDTFYTHEITAGGGAQDLQPSLYADADTFGEHTLSATINLSPPLYSDDDTFNSHTLAASIGLDAALFTDSDAFYQQSLTATIDLQPPLYSDADTFEAHALTASIELTPSLFSDGDTFYSAALSGGGSQELQPPLFANQNLFYQSDLLNFRASGELSGGGGRRMMRRKRTLIAPAWRNKTVFHGGTVLVEPALDMAIIDSDLMMVASLL